MGASWWIGRLCKSPVWVFYSRKGCRKEFSDTESSEPVPVNVGGAKKLDDFSKSIMGQGEQVLNQDATMKKFQQKILDVLGFLFSLWKELEIYKKCHRWYCASACWRSC